MDMMRIAPPNSCPPVEIAPINSPMMSSRSWVVRIDPEMLALESAPRMAYRIAFR